MADGHDEADGLEGRVLALARDGLGRVEIAAALELGEADLMALERARPTLALAMRRAAALERAWWEALPREALAGGHRFNLGDWLAALRWRWGEGPSAPPPPPPARPY